MSDPIAQAAQQLNETEQKPDGIIGEVMGAVHALEEKVEHLIHPDAPAVATPGEPLTGSTGTSNTSPATDAPQTISSESSAPDSPKPVEPAAGATAVSESAPPALAASTGAETGEHPHTPILRNIVGMLRRKFVILDGELENLVKLAESHL